MSGLSNLTYFDMSFNGASSIPDVWSTVSGEPDLIVISSKFHSLYISPDVCRRFEQFFDEFTRISHNSFLAGAIVRSEQSSHEFSGFK